MSVLSPWSCQDYQSRWFIAAIAAMTFTACSDDEPTDPEGPPPPPAAVSLSISPNSVTLLPGEVANPSAYAYGAQGQIVSAVVEWASEDPGIATVSRTSGSITAVGVGTTTVTASSQGLVARATVTVIAYHPAARILLTPSDEVLLYVGSGQRLSAVVLDAQGRATSAPVEWTSRDPGIATIGRTDGHVAAIAPGSTILIATSGIARSEVVVEVMPSNFLMQWASTATASSSYGSDSWSPAQAIGAPNVATCNDESNAWASAGPGLDWLELRYQTPVRPTEVRIYEVWAPGAIVKVEVKDQSNVYHTVYTAAAKASTGCLNTLRIPISTITEPVVGIRLTLDQQVHNDWTEIDAVRLLGYRIN
jgi:hypothetical protein